MGQPVGIGIVGCGRILQMHVEGYARLAPAAQIVALCDLDAELVHRRADEFGVERRYTDPARLAGDEAVHVVSVLTPPDVRRDLCCLLLDAGKHLLVEKPFALETSEAAAIVSRAASVQRTLAVNQNFRWFGVALQVRQHVQAGHIGQPTLIAQHDTIWRDETEGWRNTTDQLALSVMGVHWIDRFRWMLGQDAQAAYCCSASPPVLSSRGESVATLVYEFRDGALGCLTHSWASLSEGQAGFTQVDGTEGSVLIRGDDVTLFRRGCEPSEVQVPTAFSHTFGESLRRLLEAIAEGREPPHSGRDNLNTVAMLEGAYRSAAEARRVDLAELLPGA